MDTVRSSASTKHSVEGYEVLPIVTWQSRSAHEPAATRSSHGLPASVFSENTSGYTISTELYAGRTPWNRVSIVQSKGWNTSELLGWNAKSSSCIGSTYNVIPSVLPSIGYLTPPTTSEIRIRNALVSWAVFGVYIIENCKRIVMPARLW